MNNSVSDQVNCVLDDANQCLHLSLRGEDRPQLISRVTRALDQSQLYVASMTFHLRLASKEAVVHGVVPFEMQVIAKGSPENLRDTHEKISSESLINQLPRPTDGPNLGSLQNATMMQLRLYTPDRAGLTAMISEAVANEYSTGSSSGAGNFIHLLAATYNDGGPQGGTPYFVLCAEIAAPDLEIAKAIKEGVLNTARTRGIEGDIQISMLGAG